MILTSTWGEVNEKHDRRGSSNLGSVEPMRVMEQVVYVQLPQSLDLRIKDYLAIFSKHQISRDWIFFFAPSRVICNKRNWQSSAPSSFTFFRRQFSRTALLLINQSSYHYIQTWKSQNQAHSDLVDSIRELHNFAYSLRCFKKSIFYHHIRSA